MFDVERFIDDCRGVLREGDARAAVCELTARAVSEPDQMPISTG